MKYQKKIRNDVITGHIDLNMRIIIQIDQPQSGTVRTIQQWHLTQTKMRISIKK